MPVIFLNAVWNFLLIVGPVSLVAFFIGWLSGKKHKEKIFKSFVDIEPPKKDKKMISFMQTRVDNVMSSLARDIQKAIIQEESFLKSDEKKSFDRPFSVDVLGNSSTFKKQYLMKCNEITRTKKTFWTLHKIVKSYGFQVKLGFKDYIESSNE